MELAYVLVVGTVIGAFLIGVGCAFGVLGLRFMLWLDSLFD